MSKEQDFIYWTELRIKIKEKYPILTDADVEWRDTTHEDLLGTIANNLGITKKELKEVIKLA